MTYKNRGFEPVHPDHRFHAAEPTLPTRGTAASAGYDIYSPETLTLGMGETAVIWTDVKAYMQPSEVLLIYPRSSMGKKGLRFLNTVGVIDADYYGNPNNDGNIGLMIENVGADDLVIKAGDRVAQGIFTPYLLADGDDVTTTRTGGTGSTGS